MLSILPDANELQSVIIYDISEHRYSQRLSSAGFSAWTDSSNNIFIADRDRGVEWLLGQIRRVLDDDAAEFVDTLLDAIVEVHWLNVLYHESRHIRQFRRAGGRPRNYTTMMCYEIEAYNQTFSWLEEFIEPQYPAASAIKEYADQSAIEFEQAIENQGGDPDAPCTSYTNPDPNVEAFYRSWLVSTGRLPQHDSLDQLYQV